MSVHPGLVSSESSPEGHPDKLATRISEAVLAEGVTVPRDLGGEASCTAMTEAICRALG